MKKKDLLKLLEKYPDDAEVVIQEMEMEEVVEPLREVGYGWRKEIAGAYPPVDVIEDEQEAKDAGVHGEPRVIVLST